MRQLQRVDAVDGKRLRFGDPLLRDIVQEDALAHSQGAHMFGAYTIIHDGRGNLVRFDNHLTPGGIACAMSHRRALQRLVQHPTAKWGLILEDDVNLAVPDADLAIGHLLRRLPADWDAVYLGYADSRSQAHAAALGDPGEEMRSDERAIEAAAACPNFSDLEIEEVCRGLPGLYAWMVTKEAARAILENVFPISGQVDLAISRWLAAERGRVFCVPKFDMLFLSPRSEDAIDSDVQTMATVDTVLKEHASLEEYSYDSYMAMASEGLYQEWGEVAHDCSYLEMREEYIDSIFQLPRYVGEREQGRIRGKCD